MKRYVLGFAFDHAHKHVLLIRKTHPESQNGKLNGIGGHIKECESPLKAMIREFEEEADYGSFDEQWHPLMKISDNRHTYEMYIFFAHMHIEQCRTRTDEALLIVPVCMLDRFEVVSDLLWIIPMASDTNIKIVFSHEEDAAR